MSTVLALGAHPDDIEIGCGGTLAVLTASGREVHMYVASDGAKGGEGKVRRAEQSAAAAILGVQQMHWGGLEDTCLPGQAASLMAQIEVLVRRLKPQTVLVNYHEDTHQDHRALARAAHAATRYVPNVLAYETPTSNGFAPHVFSDIGATFERKIAALKAHASQVERTNIQGLTIIDIATATAHFRGIQGRLNSAEGFVPVRMQL